MGNSQKDMRFGLGLIIGSVVGSIAALLLSPKSGKQNRAILEKKMEDWKKMMDSGELEKKVRSIFDDVNEETVRLYATAREKVMHGIEELKHMDGDDYAKLVQRVIDDLKKHSKANVDKMNKLKESLIKDWPEMKDEVEKEGKKLAKDFKTNGQAKKTN